MKPGVGGVSVHKGNQRGLYARAGGAAMADERRTRPVSLPKGLLGDAAADCSGIWISGTDCGCLNVVVEVFILLLRSSHTNP